MFCFWLPPKWFSFWAFQPHLVSLSISHSVRSPCWCTPLHIVSIVYFLATSLCLKNVRYTGNPFQPGAMMTLFANYSDWTNSKKFMSNSVFHVKTRTDIKIKKSIIFSIIYLPTEMVALVPPHGSRGSANWPECPWEGSVVPADALAGLQGAAQVHFVERGRAGASEGMATVAVSTLYGSPGHSDGLALSSSKRRLLASLCCCGSPPGYNPRPPCSATVRHGTGVKHRFHFCSRNADSDLSAVIDHHNDVVNIF